MSLSVLGLAELWFSRWCCLHCFLTNIFYIAFFFLHTIWGMLLPSPPLTVKGKTIACETGLCKTVTSTPKTAGVFKAAWESSQLSTNVSRVFLL